jgi:hypothetical protein
MDDAVQERFIREHRITNEQIKDRETWFNAHILPLLKKRYLSHLVSTLEDLINNKQKQDFLDGLERVLGRGSRERNREDLKKQIKSAVNSQRLRVFSIILAPVGSGKVNARTNFIKGCALITYWQPTGKTLTKSRSGPSLPMNWGIS